MSACTSAFFIFSELYNKRQYDHIADDLTHIVIFIDYVQFTTKKGIGYTTIELF